MASRSSRVALLIARPIPDWHGRLLRKAPDDSTALTSQSNASSFVILPAMMILASLASSATLYAMLALARFELVIQELPQCVRIEVLSDHWLDSAWYALHAIFVSAPRSCAVHVVCPGWTHGPVSLLILCDRQCAWDRLEFDPTIQSIAGIVLCGTDDEFA